MHFLNILHQVLEREKFTPKTMYTCEEIGVQTAHKARKPIF